MASMPAEAALDVDVVFRMLERERAARKRAEQLMAEKCRELFLSHHETQRTARALEKEACRSRAVFNTAAEGIIIFDGNGRIESLNLAAEQIFGISVPIAELNICQLLPQVAFCLNRGQCLVNSLRTILGESNETQGCTLEGAAIPLEFVISEFEANGSTAFSGIVRDLTRRKQLESKLAQAQKLESVGQLAAGIAHELNTPIQFVANNTRFLKDAFQSIALMIELYDGLLKECEFHEPVLAQIQRLHQTRTQADLDFLLEEIPLAINQNLEGTNNVARIVKAMKGFSHPGTENFQEIDLNSALENTLIVSRNEWKYCADLVTHYMDDLPPVRCLPGELNQVFLNLIVNAAHAIQDKVNSSASKGTLAVRTGFDDQHVFVEVTDSGTGISPEIRPKIFDPFFTTKGVGKGTGQGLAISYGIIVELHKGSINFASEVGVGTTFRIELPRNRA